MNICAVVMAGKDSTEMNSDRIKHVHRVAGKPIISWVHEALAEAGVKDELYVVGERQEQIREILGEDKAYVFQEQLLGTGHATMQAANFLESRDGLTLLMPGDTPLITGETLKLAVEKAIAGDYDALLLTAVAPDPRGYGRIIREAEGGFASIKEEEDLDEAERLLTEVSSSMYVFKTSRLLSALGKLGMHGDNRPYHLSDTFSRLLEEGGKIEAIQVPFDEILDVNNRQELTVAGRIMNLRICGRHARNGVSIISPQQTYIEDEVEIGNDCTIWPGTVLSGHTIIGHDCVLRENTLIESSQVGDEVTIRAAEIRNSSIGDHCFIGAYSSIHDGAWLDRDCVIGSGANISNAILGPKVIVQSHAYICDADIDEGVQFGAGAVTANSDGAGKSFRTVIGQLSVIGAQACLVAPIEIEENSYVAAGSVVTETVRPFDLAIARSRQRNVDNWVRRQGSSNGPV